jgi:uncharacterized protein
MIRETIKQALVAAMKGGDAPRRDTIRLIQSQLKNRDIELRGAAGGAGDDDVLVMEVLQKMIKQRRESIDMYKKGGREELAAIEAAEIAVIEDFLPAQMSDDALADAIDAIVAETGAQGMKDMGRVMALVKERLAGQADMSKASAAVKARLSA